MTTLTAVSFMRHRLENYAPGDSVPCSYEEWVEIFNALEAAEAQFAAEKERAERAETERNLLVRRFVDVTVLENDSICCPTEDAQCVNHCHDCHTCWLEWAAAEAEAAKEGA